QHLPPFLWMLITEKSLPANFTLSTPSNLQKPPIWRISIQGLILPSQGMVILFYFFTQRLSPLALSREDKKVFWSFEGVERIKLAEKYFFRHQHRQKNVKLRKEEIK